MDTQADAWPLSCPRPPGWCHLHLCWPEDTRPAQSPDQNSVPPGCACTINPTEMRGRRSEEASEDVTARPCWSEWDLGLVPQSPLPGMANWLRAWQQRPSSRFPGLQNVAAQWRGSSGAVAGLIRAAEARAPAQLGLDLDDRAGCQDSSFVCGQDEPLKQRGRQALTDWCVRSARSSGNRWPFSRVAPGLWVRWRCRADLGAVPYPRAAELAEIRPRAATRQVAGSLFPRRHLPGPGQGPFFFCHWPSSSLEQREVGQGSSRPLHVVPVAVHVAPLTFTLPSAPPDHQSGVQAAPASWFKGLEKTEGIFPIFQNAPPGQLSLPGGSACFLIPDLESTLSGML